MKKQGTVPGGEKMKTVLIAEIAILLIIGLCASAKFTPCGRQSSMDFEKGITGWITLDKSVATLAHEKEAASVHEGKGSLRCEFHFEEGKIPAFGTPGLRLAGKKGLRFWVKSSAPALLGVIVKEKGKGHYVYPVALGEANTWKEVSVNFSDMTEGEHSRDENGHLDLDGASLGFIDILPMFTKDGEKRTLWIDTITLADEEVAATKARPYRSSFEADTEEWLAVNSHHSAIKICRDGEHVREGKGSLEFDYTITPESLIGLGAMGIKLDRCSAIDFWIKTEEPSELLIALEKKNKARYIYKFETAAKTWKHVSAPLNQFTLAEESRDDEGSLNRARLKSQIFLADVDNFTYFKEGDQKLWIDDFRIIEGEGAKK
jgi:hypothetical protein